MHTPTRSSGSNHQLSHSQEDLERLVVLALEEAKRLGASEAEVGVSVDTGLSVTARLGEVETLEYQRDRGMGVTIYRGKRKGSASTADLSERAIRDTVAKAYSIAGFTAEDDCAGLPDPDTIAKDPPDLDLCHPWSIEPDQARDLAVACEAAARGRVRSGGTRLRQAHRQFGRRHVVDASWAACLRQHARVSRRLCDQPA